MPWCQQYQQCQLPTLKNKTHVHNPNIGRDLKYQIMLCRKYSPLKDDKCISGLAHHLCKVKGPQFSSCCAMVTMRATCLLIASSSISLTLILLHLLNLCQSIFLNECPRIRCTKCLGCTKVWCLFHISYQALKQEIKKLKIQGGLFLLGRD